MVCQTQLLLLVGQPRFSLLLIKLGEDPILLGWLQRSKLVSHGLVQLENINRQDAKIASNKNGDRPTRAIVPFSGHLFVIGSDLVFLALLASWRFNPSIRSHSSLNLDLSRRFGIIGHLDGRTPDQRLNAAGPGAGLATI